MFIYIGLIVFNKIAPFPAPTACGGTGDYIEMYNYDTVNTINLSRWGIDTFAKFNAYVTQPEQLWHQMSNCVSVSPRSIFRIPVTPMEISSSYLHHMIIK
jgi:hypothetical protein